MKFLHVSSIVILAAICVSLQVVNSSTTSSTSVKPSTGGSSSTSAAVGKSSATPSPATKMTSVPSSKGGASTGTSGGAVITTPSGSKVLLSKLSKKCRTHVQTVFLKITTTPVSCDEYNKNKGQLSTKECTKDDFDTLKDSTCFCPQNVANLVMIAVLCVFAKAFGQ